MGVEILVYLPRFHDFQVDNIVGAIIDRHQKIIFQIGEKKNYQNQKNPQGRWENCRRIYQKIKSSYEDFLNIIKRFFGKNIIRSAEQNSNISH